MQLGQKSLEIVCGYDGIDDTNSVELKCFNPDTPTEEVKFDSGEIGQLILSTLARDQQRRASALFMTLYTVLKEEDIVLKERSSRYHKRN
ncbi:MAG: hypothetical protein LBL71_00610 [Endomicrobium sp.]|jgi:hypothetical protein|nr:hypothetical protein [Endomicrobium sp.]